MKRIRPRGSYSPAQHTQDEVDDEEGPKDDQRHKVDPGHLDANGVIHLEENQTEPINPSINQYISDR